MFITKVEIENLKCFKERVSFDLDPNGNQIDLDIQKGYFIRRSPDELIFSPLASIGGANAKGKTTLLESIAFFCNYFNQSIFGEFLANIFFEKKIHPDKIPLYNSIIFNNDKNVVLDSSDKILISEIKELLKKHYFNIYNNNANDNKEEIKIKIFFGTNNQSIKNKKFSVELLVNNKGFFHNLYNFDSKIITNTGFIKQIEDLIIRFSTQTYFVRNEAKNMFETYSDNVIWHIEARIIDLKNIIKGDKLISLLRLADPDVEDIDFIKDENNAIRKINHINFKNGSQINVGDLSTGTQKFVKILHQFYTLIIQLEKNDSENKVGGLILVDEIETSLHHSLVNFFKKFIYKIVKTRDIQMFFTSHDPYILSSYISNKQIFLIEDDELEDKRKITKVSSSPKIRKNNNFVKKYLESKIGSHPSENDIDIELGDI